MRAQLKIFSGRPDPEFELPAAVAAELSNRLQSAVGESPSEPPPLGGLGYRGFAVGEDLERPAYEVFAGVITEVSDGENRHWLDTAGLEDLLITQAREAGLGELLDAVGLGGGQIA